MNKLPTKQIYLLLIIVVGILTLSVYSTYAIFTLESETSNIVNINTPNILTVSTEMYEYKQLTVPKHSYITTDVDIYNSHEYELCYSVWYKIASTSVSENKIKLYQNSEGNLTTSGLIESMNSKRISLIVINDNDKDVKINIGISSSKNKGTCELNISKDKSQVTSVLNNPQELTDTIIKNIGNKVTEESGYLTYKNQKTPITLENEIIYVANSFEYKDEVFSLKSAESVKLNNIMNYQSNDEISYYMCMENTECNELYKINKIDNKEDTNYKMTNYDKYIGYLKGNSGIKKVNKNNKEQYVYYGDNPNNFIYYNCTNELDTKTCELWRIIGVVFDESEQKYITKIIRNDSIGTYKFDDSTNTWNDSLINEYLNKKYKINNNRHIKEINVNQENITDLSLSLDKIEILKNKKTSTVSIMHLSDYLNASICENKKINEYNVSCFTSNWLNKSDNTFEWTNSIKYIETKNEEVKEENTDEVEETTEENIIVPLNNTAYSVGPKTKETLVTDALNIRPVVHLKSRILISSGDGTLENPYIIK